MPPPTTSGNYVPLPPTLPLEEEKKKDKKKKASKKLKKLDDSDSSDDDSSRSPKLSPYYNVVARDPKDYKKHKHRTSEVLPDNVRYEAIRPGGKESPRLKRRDSKSGRYHDVDWTPRYTGDHATSRDLSATRKTSKKLEEALQTTSYKAKEAEDAALHNYTAAYNEALKAKATEKELENLRKQYASLSLDLKDAAELNTKLSNRLKDSELREREKALEERQWVEISGNPKPRTIDRAPLGSKPLINRPIRPAVPKTATGMDAMDAIQRDYQSRRANENNEYITGGALADRRRERRRP